MNRTIGYISFGVLTILLSAFSLWQQQYIEIQYNAFSKEKLSHKQTLKTLVTEKDRAGKLLAENSVLSNAMANLKKELVVKNVQLNHKDTRIKQSSNELEAVRASLAHFERLNAENDQTINTLKNNKNDLQRQVELLNKTLENTSEDLLTANSKNIRYKQKFEKEAQIKRITARTWVEYNTVDVRKKLQTSNIANISSGTQKWKYTYFEINFKHPEVDLLAGNSFILKIIDMDSKEVIQYIEANPQFPDSEMSMAGVEFKFENNPVKLLHYNSQVKNGKNYEARIYLISDGQEYLVQNSKMPIIVNGKPFSL